MAGYGLFFVQITFQIRNVFRLQIMKREVET